MPEQDQKIDFGALRTLMMASVLAGAAVFVLTLWQLDQFKAFDLGWSVLAFAFGVIIWSAVFYFGCLIMAGSLTSYIERDDTKIKGDTVEMVTKTRSSGDARLDAWVGRFVFARNTFGLSVLPVLILVGLYFWG